MGMQTRFIVNSNRVIARDVLRMRLLGDTRRIARPGQFVQVAVPGFYLRRPISVCEWKPGMKGHVEIIYKVVGRGTQAMSRMEEGAALDLLTGMGNGYDLDLAEVGGSQAPLLVGGGVGAPPLYGLCKRLLAIGMKPIVVLGFGSCSDAFLWKEFEDLKVMTQLFTLDGGMGKRGLVTEGMKELRGKYDYVFACGPEPMLQTVHQLAQEAEVCGQYSFEERMACGFGVCMGCSCRTRYGNKRICKDGPVMLGEEILW
ncbi:MAG: dihydroorotate dehydrogenase electron transfer subunit [Clostridia bacterium]|nr:dihydroorotate dehydrogenase electron transfer subunit [Clostridia bacterium]